MREGGEGILRSFCCASTGTNISSRNKSFDLRWDRLLGRACAILGKCYPGIPLPLNNAKQSPLTFDLGLTSGLRRQNKRKHCCCTYALMLQMSYHVGAGKQFLCCLTPKKLKAFLCVAYINIVTLNVKSIFHCSIEVEKEIDLEISHNN